MGYENYTDLTEDEITMILSLTGKEVFEYCRSHKLKGEKMKQMCAFCLNQHGIKHDRAVNFTPPPGYRVITKLYWEKYI